jgi:hypothetical protein
LFPPAAVVYEVAAALANQYDAGQGHQGAQDLRAIGIDAYFVGIQYQQEGKQDDKHPEPFIADFYQCSRVLIRRAT